MSKGKKRKHHSSSSRSQSYSSSEGSILSQDTSSSKRFNPMARNLLFADIVILGFAALGERYGFISPVVSSVLTVMGFLMLLAALWFQFGGGGKKDGGGPRTLK